MNQLVKPAKRIVAFLVIKLFFRPQYWLRYTWPVWFYLLNVEGRKLYNKNHPTLNSVQKRIVSDLKRDGIAITTLAELFPDKDYLGSLKKYIEEIRSNAHADKDKTFLIKFWEYNEPLNLSHPFFKLALEKRVLDIVNSYLDMFSKFFYHSLNITVPVSRDTPPIKSQRWHRDPEDKKQCKMFIYFTDVDEGSGPFVYIKESHYGGKWFGVFKQIPPQGTYPSREEVDKVIPPEYIKVFTGKAGTIIFCDTIGLHRGGYATDRERLMYTAEYSSKAAFIPMRYIVSNETKQRLGTEDAAVKYAVDKALGLVGLINAITRFSTKHNLY